MARRKKIVNDKIKTERLDKNSPYSMGDFCYYLDVYNKVRFCEIKKAFLEKDEQIYLAVDQTDHKFVVVQHCYCADDEKSLKSIKRKVTLVATKNIPNEEESE